ncbi:hypothetical protein CAPTEDRAFT_183796 [Capitella teleta]|uniref:U2A'/phosphoprotein 32 family A C-terminal domain-containing protein n=1 Tax=Capitella teleta TaxID=283909 RepID=R7USF3_CAPTE|nr:hypothetical protein CAPTEDRAFT_183796 [Capitella teleta]|eukprot:ELU09120.1 hypothetical protein CAPTEDRAFT_183796 [Capitella teleta]
MSDQENEENFDAEEGEEETPVAAEDAEEEEEKDADMPLTEEMLTECLSLLCKTGDGMAHAYVKLDAHDRELTDISILQGFIHLRFVDINKNNLRDISALNSLSHMVALKAEHNKLTSAKLDELPYLQEVSFNSNKIKTTEGICHPLVEKISLNLNEITYISGLNPDRLSRLHTLELRGNKLTSTAGLCLPNLKNLFLGANQITKIEGLEALEQLSTLHLRDNQIETLDGFTENLKNLQYINLRGNNVSVVKEAKKLQCLPVLRAIVLSDNPCAEEDDYRLEILISIRKIERLDKDEYTDDERQDAQEIYEQRRQEEKTAEVRGRS